MHDASVFILFFLQLIANAPYICVRIQLNRKKNSQAYFINQAGYSEYDGHFIPFSFGVQLEWLLLPLTMTNVSKLV